MKKEKLFKVGVINESTIDVVKDTATFYTSDTELWLGFELSEVGVEFDSAEILMFNIYDKSFVVRSVGKTDDKYWYELDMDIIAHHGQWKVQLQFTKNSEVYTSKHFNFRIENDLSNERPPKLIDITNWSNIKQTADSLIAEMKVAVKEAIKAESERQTTFETNESERDETFNINENTRQTQESEREKAENNRQTTFSTNESNRTEMFNANEATRQENETTRQLAESQRQSTFETNESERQATFETAEQERQSAELIRVGNENQRQTEIENIKDIVYVNMKNLVNNSNVSKGLENWTSVTTQSTLSVENNDLKVTYLNKVDNLYINNTTQVAYNDNMYYSIVRFNPVNLTGTVRLRHNGEYRQTKSIGSQNEFQTISSVFNGSGVGNQIEFRVFALDTKAGDYFYVDYFMLFDLTEIFGEGNEPTKEVMDLIISKNGYIEELTLKRDDIQQHEIDQLKKAVIALGGTI